jgi:CRISPR-associated protein Csd2
METKRITGMLVLEVINSNPNGDPDRDSDPRQRDNGIGEISPVSVKRKLRDLIEFKENNFIWEEVGKDLNPDEFKILESRQNERKVIKNQLENDPEGFKKTYWDARLFGNTFLEEGGGDTIRSGAIHFGVGLSVAPVKVQRETFTKKAPAQVGKSRGMAPLGFRIVEYGIYTIPIFFSPHQGQRTGCRDEDVQLFLKLIPYMYDHTRSLVRSQVNILHGHIGWHGNKLGTFKDADFFEKLCPILKKGASGGNREDYEIPSWESVKGYLTGVADYQDVVQ